MITYIQQMIRLLLLTLSLSLLTSAQAAQQPPVADTALLVWANEAIISTYTYNFADYQQQLQQISPYFTADGWQVFIDTFTKSNVLDSVKSNEYAVSAVATRPPIILTQGPVSNQYVWQVEMPILVLYQNADQEQEQHLIIQITITENKTGIRGLGIVQLNAEEIDDDT